jgi:hypothetical protein
MKTNESKRKKKTAKTERKKTQGKQRLTPATVHTREITTKPRGKQQAKRKRKG